MIDRASVRKLFATVDIEVQRDAMDAAANLLSTGADADSHIVMFWTVAMGYLQVRNTRKVAGYLARANRLTHGDPVTLLLAHASLSQAGQHQVANNTWLELTRKYGTDSGALKLAKEIELIERYRLTVAECSILVLLQADLFQFAGNRVAARALYEKLTKRAPQWSRPHINLGLLHLADGRISDAIRSLETAVALHPEDPKATLLLGDARLKAGEVDIAKGLYSAAKGRVPADAQIALGSVELKGGDLATARIQFQQARGQDLGNPAASVGLGDIDRLGKNYKGSAGHYLDALQLAMKGGYASAEPSIRLDLATVYSAAGLHHEAMDTLDEGAKRFPSYMETWNFRRADIADALHNHALAESLLRSALEAATDAQSTAIIGLENRGLIEKCVITYTAQLARNPNIDRRLSIQIALGYLYSHQGNLQKSYESRLDVSRIRPRGVDWYLLGLSAQAVNKELDAKMAFKNALSSKNLPETIRQSLSKQGGPR